MGQKIRAARKERGLSLRELARRVGVSASSISQIETGKSQPSVSRLYAIVAALGVAVDDVFPATGSSTGGVPATTRARARTEASGETASLPLPPAATWDALAESGSAAELDTDSLLVRLGSGKTLQLTDGVTWERLTSSATPGIDFLHVTYDVGASSSLNGELMRHAGIEFGFVLTGKLSLTVGFDEQVITAGDAVWFDSSRPHRLANVGDEPVHGIWFVDRR